MHFVLELRQGRRTYVGSLTRCLKTAVWWATITGLHLRLFLVVDRRATHLSCGDSSLEGEKHLFGDTFLPLCYGQFIKTNISCSWFFWLQFKTHEVSGRGDMTGAELLVGLWEKPKMHVALQWQRDRFWEGTKSSVDLLTTTDHHISLNSDQSQYTSGPRILSILGFGHVQHQDFMVIRSFPHCQTMEGKN